MEHPQLVRGEEATFLAHLTVLETGEPVRSGRLELELVDAAGGTENAIAESPARDGLFKPVGAFGRPGTFRGRIKLTSPQVSDSLEFGEVVVHPDAAALEAAAAAAGDDPPDAIPFLLEQQWSMDFRLRQVERRDLARRLVVAGRIDAAGGRSAAASPPLPGRLLAPAHANLPRIGDRVVAGDLLAYIEPPLTVVVEIEQSVAQAQAHLSFCERAFERISALREKGLGTQGEFDEAERNLRVADVEHARAQRVRASFHEAGAVSDSLEREVSGPGSPLALAIHAPISGTVVAVNHVEGEYVEVSDPLYRITNTEVVWVTGQVPEFDLAELPQAPRAVVALPSHPGRLFDISELGGTLVSIGSVIDQQTRTLPIIYELPNAGGQLRIGMLADLYLETRHVHGTLAIPQSAIVLDAGRATAYVLLNGESFQRRDLVLGMRDNGFVEVLDGLGEGEWVVATGGNAIKLAALSPASFGHGHAH